jgi:UDP:flavonoid glycosyltransferase YjiC (YdhE family)
LLSKPADWSDNIDVCGFSFLSSASDYTPPDDLLAFLQAGQPPIYIGFGSIIVDDPQALIKTIRAAIQKAGQRAIISKGWGGLGAVESDNQEGIFLLGDCPHDWLFQHVSCVVHHGGAGTVATGLKAGCPTVVVPFFGDQPFWGAIIAREGVGPSPIPYKELTVDKLADAILEALNPSPRQKAREISEIIQGESGIENAISSFHGHLHYERMRCALCPSRPAVWWVGGPRLALSAFATTVLVEAGLLDPCDIKL